MAKYTAHITGDFDSVLRSLQTGILEGSASASYEDGSDYRSGDVRCAVRVFERYSWTGSNRVSLNVTLVGSGDALFLTAITAGGSQAMFFKLNTLGEEAFLGEVVKVVDRLNPGRG